MARSEATQRRFCMNHLLILLIAWFGSSVLLFLLWIIGCLVMQRHQRRVS